jgi:hypothetical protein
MILCTSSPRCDSASGADAAARISRSRSVEAGVCRRCHGRRLLNNRESVVNADFHPGRAQLLLSDRLSVSIDFGAGWPAALGPTRLQGAAARASDQTFMRKGTRFAMLHLPSRGCRKCPSVGSCDAGPENCRFPPTYVFNGLQPPKTAVRPCTAAAVAFCDCLSNGEGTSMLPDHSMRRRQLT